MKYTPVVAAIFLTLGKVLAQDEGGETMDPEEPGWGARVREAVSNSLNAVQNVQIPTLGTGALLATVECDDTTTSESECFLVGGVKGVNVCRTVAGAEVTVCVPKVLGNYVGANNDQCGCCGAMDDNGQRTGEKCKAEEKGCLCPCQDGRGIVVKHDIVKAFGRQISWNACYTPNIAANVLASRPEFSCFDGCEEAIAAAAAAAAAEGGTV